MKKQILTIKWIRLVEKEKTCPRCFSTERNLDYATAFLKHLFESNKVSIILKKKKLAIEKFKRKPLVSNSILINGFPLEHWLNGETKQSKCCNVCGSSECRTVKVGSKVYETIPSYLIILAGIIALTENRK